MTFRDSFKHAIFDIKESDFFDSAKELFDYQYDQNSTYHDFCRQLGTNPSKIQNIEDIPFLPIEFYKSHAIKTGSWKEEKIFLSSGTTSNLRSGQYVRDLDYYHETAKKCFEYNYDIDLSDIVIYALLPAYGPDSSLIEMIYHFMRYSHPKSKFCSDFHELKFLIEAGNVQKMVIGVSHALVKAATTQSCSPKNTFFMETGGMKGKQKELTREELHQILKKSFGVDKIHSEYGMTELTSQAYAQKNGNFQFPPWVKVVVREINDPFTTIKKRLGGINIIDLANVDTCAFIETKDLGISNKKGQFQVIGRMDNSDIRGCNLLF